MGSQNRYLQGNFAPVREEQELSLGKVEGNVPEDLAGFFLRNGPNMQFDPVDDERYHPFDGDGMIHSVEFGGGKATYRNRWIRTPGFERERAEGKSLWSGFGSGAERVAPADMPMKNLANTALAFHDGRLLATWEGGLPTEVGLRDLDTRGEFSWGGGWTDSITAHPKVDPRTGEMIVFCYNPVEQPYFRHGVVDKNGKVTHKAGVELPGKGVMIHDMAITAKHSLILDMPVTFSLERVMEGKAPFLWEPSNGTRIGVLPRYGDGKDVKWFDVGTGYIFHVFNAWDEGDEVVMEGCRAKATSILEESEIPVPDTWGRLTQYRLNLTSGKTTERQVNDTPLEFSRVNENYLGEKTRYGYASRFDEEHEDVGLRFTAMLKWDHDEERLDKIELAPGQYTQEIVFAPKVGSASEDDGYVVGFVHDENDDRSECWVVDAQRFSDGPIAKIEIPTRVPYGFHSHWVGS